MDEPSNHVPCLTDSSSRWIGIVTALTWPMMSVNWSWTKRMPDDVAASILAVDSWLLATWTMPPGGTVVGAARIRPAAEATGRIRWAVGGTATARCTGRTRTGAVGAGLPWRPRA